MLRTRKSISRENVAQYLFILTASEDFEEALGVPRRQSTRVRKKRLDLAAEIVTINAIVIRGEDYYRLDDAQFLNDSLIELQLK